MPELPEVETTVRGLRRVLPGLRFKSVWTDWKKSFRAGSLSQIKKCLLGKKIFAVGRRGKNIIIVFEGEWSLLVHMKMTGHLLYGKWKLEGRSWKPTQSGPLNDPYNRFIHVLFTLSNGKMLAFSDVRKFGKIWIEKTLHLSHSPHLAHLGPEPIDSLFTEKVLRERLLKRANGKIKQVLMDQSVMAGIGNIYSDEILWRAGIHPEIKPKTLKDKEWRALYEGAKTLLKKGVKLGGDSTSDYRNIFGEKGAFHLRHEAYQRTGKKCRRKNCRGVIIRKMIGGRSGHYCPAHQKQHAPGQKRHE